MCNEEMSEHLPFTEKELLRSAFECMFLAPEKKFAPVRATAAGPFSQISVQ